jgi:hypothetical protein
VVIDTSVTTLNVLVEQWERQRLVSSDVIEWIFAGSFTRGKGMLFWRIEGVFLFVMQLFMNLSFDYTRRKESSSF